MEWIGLPGLLKIAQLFLTPVTFPPSKLGRGVVLKCTQFAKSPLVKFRFDKVDSFSLYGSDLGAFGEKYLFAFSSKSVFKKTGIACVDIETGLIVCQFKERMSLVMNGFGDKCIHVRGDRGIDGRCARGNDLVALSMGGGGSKASKASLERSKEVFANVGQFFGGIGEAFHGKSGKG